MKYLKSKEWWKAAAVRAIKTFSQTATALIGSAVFFEEVKWLLVLSGAGLAALLSLLTSLNGLPEVEVNDEK